MFGNKCVSGLACILCFMACGTISGHFTGNVAFSVAEAQDFVSGEHVMPTYWIARNRNSDSIMVEPQRIVKVNQAIMHKNSIMTSLEFFPETVSGDDIHRKMLLAMKEYSGWEVPKLFKNGQLLSWNEWKAIRDNCGYETPISEQTVLYGVSIRRTSIRLLPTNEHLLAAPQSPGRDCMYGGVLNPAEAVAVLAVSKDRRFYFVQSRSSMGWVDGGSVALTSREIWTNYAAPMNYLVVTADHKNITIDGIAMDFQMGARIPITLNEGGTVQIMLPSVENGSMVNRFMKLPNDDTVHVGPLPFSRANLIRQAFRFLGRPYNWDGTSSISVTDAYMVTGIYRTVGIELPQTLAEQESVMPILTSLGNMDEAGRYAALFDIQPGALLFQKGHVMFYLGRDGDGDPTVIHAHESGVTVSDLYDEESDANGINMLTNIGIIR